MEINIKDYVNKQGIENLKGTRKRAFHCLCENDCFWIKLSRKKVSALILISAVFVCLGMWIVSLSPNQNARIPETILEQVMVTERSIMV